MDLGIIEVPEWVQEVEVPPAQSTAPDTGADRLGWEEPGMGPVADIVRQNPELAGTVSELMEGALARNTMVTYQKAVARYQNFCETVGYDRAIITEKTVLHYISFLRHNGASYNVLCQVKPALGLLLELYTGQKAALTVRVDRWLSAAKRLAAEQRPPVKKAAEISFQEILDMVRLAVSPHLDDPGRINAIDFRCVVKTVIIYYTFCRFADYRHLQAKHVELCGEDLLITFPKAKNDQFHNGQSTILKANGSEICPVRIVKLYFNRFRLQFGQAAGDTTPLHCMMRRNGGSHYAQKRVASASLAKENFDSLLLRCGHDPSGKTEKSVKMTGVTKMLEAGATSRETAQQGRWISEEMPLRYKYNSLEYKKQIAAKVPFQ
jgi:hypothetical protein